MKRLLSTEAQIALEEARKLRPDPERTVEAWGVSSGMRRISRA